MDCSSRYTVARNAFTLGKLLEMNLGDFSDAVNDTCNAAGKELAIESGLQKIKETWTTLSLDLFPYSKGDVARGFILKGTEEITTSIDENMTALQAMGGSKFVVPFLDDVKTMGGSKFFVPFLDDVKGWEKKLSTIGECCDIWLVVQRKWQYLEGIFVGSDDIRLQRKWQYLEGIFVGSDDIRLQACLAEGRLQTLAEMSGALDKCQKSLTDYLETKRNAFPRFFFISDDELLSEHMLKLFDNCAELIFARNNKVVKGMISSEGESFDYRTQTPVEGAVETWMLAVAQEMKVSLLAIMKESVFFYPRNERLKWMDSSLGMYGAKLKDEVNDLVRK
ncbi:dynein heavy chain, N-terminal region 2-domain-containing protein, partial [Baffinella frigidus]